MTPNAGYRAWSSQCCRSCHAWLPSMDLNLKNRAANESIPDKGFAYVKSEEKAA